MGKGGEVMGGAVAGASKFQATRGGWPLLEVSKGSTSIAISAGAGRCWKVLEGAGRCWKILEGAGMCWEVTKGVEKCWKVQMKLAMGCERKMTGNEDGWVRGLMGRGTGGKGGWWE